jgi:hypothetical protein
MRSAVPHLNVRLVFCARLQKIKNAGVGRAAAGKEQDPQKLIELVKEIHELLDAKQKRLAGNPPPKT